MVNGTPQVMVLAIDFMDFYLTRPKKPRRGRGFDGGFPVVGKTFELVVEEIGFEPM